MANKPKTNSVINGNNYFRVRVLLGYDENGKKVFKNFYGSSKSDAENKKKEYIKSIESGLNPDLSSQSLSLAMNTWLWEIEKYSGNKSSSFERYEGIFRNYLKDSTLGLLTVSEIKKLPVQKYYNMLIKEGKSYSQVKNIHKLLNKFFNYAESDGYVIKNPLRGLKIPKESEEEIEKKAEKIETFSDDEIKKILESLGNVKLRYIVEFALSTGAREAEILALDKNTDIIGKTVKINKSVRNVRVYEDNSKTKYHYELKVTKPKTQTSIREIPISNKLHQSLRNLNKIVSEERLKLGPAYNENTLLFPSLTGTYIDSRNLIRSWKRALDNANIPYKKFHALRHTYATKLIDSGMNIITVSRLLGHSSTKITEIYLHPLDNISEDDLNKLENIF